MEADTQERLLAHIDTFLASWNAHGHPVVGARDLLQGRFLMIAADEEATGVSGCSIDSLYRVLKAAERDFGLSMLDSSLVFYRTDSGEVESASRAEFRALVENGAVADDTIVFDNTVASVGAMRQGEWERPLRESWHAAAFARRD